MFKGDVGGWHRPDRGRPAPRRPARPTTRPPTKALDEAETAFADAQKALTAGDLGAYQTKMKEAEAAVQRALRALGQ